jgi:hypothetical protein
MKKILLSLMTMAIIFTLALSSSNTYAANGRNVEIVENTNLSTPPSPQSLPRPYWVPFHQGGFDRFSATATRGNEGMHNMVRATLTDQLYIRLQYAFNNGEPLGKQRDDSISHNIIVPTTPQSFHISNVIYNLGYRNHRGWNNVWGYQNGGNLAAGMHNRNQNMAWFRPFPITEITTLDRTIAATISYVNSNTINVRLTRLQNGSSNNPIFTTNANVFLPIEMHLNRWNVAGTRVNDYHAIDNLAIINTDGEGPFAAWDIKHIQ